MQPSPLTEEETEAEREATGMGLSGTIIQASFIHSLTLCFFKASIYQTLL